jgi:hypothetical protein
MTNADGWDWAEVVEVTDYGRARREAWLAGLQARADDMTQASMEAHRPDHDRITAWQNGLFPGSPQQHAAEVADRQVTIGTDWGDGRVIERNGHLSWSIGPAPARVYQSQLDNPGQLGESPLKRYMRGGQ